MNAEQEIIAAIRAAGLISLAELGDKSQLVCLVLGARYGARPVLVGAALAFSLLNLLAVLIGGALAATLSPRLLAGAAAALFAVFGVLALRGGDEEEEVALEEGVRGGIATTFGVLFMAELGDKTQLMVTALAADGSPAATWVGSTLALVTLAGLGALAGRAALTFTSVRTLRRLGGVLFLVFAVVYAREALLG